MAALTLLSAGAALAQDSAPAPKLPDAIVWTRLPDNPAQQVSYLAGAEKQPGPYVIRVKLAAGGRIAPHRHPDPRVTTVLSGTVHIAFGATLDESKLVAVPPGGVYVTPANTPHYLVARGDVVYQESGIGPTGNLPADTEMH